MSNKRTSGEIALRIWFTTSLVFGAGFTVVTLFSAPGNAILSLLAFITAAVVSLPAFFTLLLALPLLRRVISTTNLQLLSVYVLCAGIAALYGFAGALLDGLYNMEMFIETFLVFTCALAACTSLSVLIHTPAIRQYFDIPTNETTYTQITQTDTHMDTQHNEPAHTTLPQDVTVAAAEPREGSKTLLKGFITGALILIMLVPTFFVSNLIKEREQRQREVVTEVSNKWAGSQTVSMPYLYIPSSYRNNVPVEENGTTQPFHTGPIVILPEELNVTGTILPEERPRSIYKVMLYRSKLNGEGKFSFTLPADIAATDLQLDQAQLCMGISDYKGIEESVKVQLNDTTYELSPGLPTRIVSTNGLSTPIRLTTEDLGKTFTFSVKLQLKGSGNLNFLPLAGNSHFTVQSNWSNPSFNGYSLPSERLVKDSGFTAQWHFNKASLPFKTVLQRLDGNQDISFGIAMVQPADQYAKTERSVKYAILFIGLTFALFFIVELLQKKPVHPVQYVLVGIALIIFYTLLISISEFILFNYAYLIAATATVLLITLYAKSHFQNWKTASLFGGVLTSLYGFIFILIQLEDTALLIGSIGLFIVLALIMYASRKINWYRPSVAA